MRGDALPSSILEAINAFDDAAKNFWALSGAFAPPKREEFVGNYIVTRLNLITTIECELIKAKIEALKGIKNGA